MNELERTALEEITKTVERVLEKVEGADARYISFEVSVGRVHFDLKLQRDARGILRRVL